jgi:hypothetical protein
VDANILLRKNYEAHGAFLPADRPHALNLLGFASQLVFTTFCLGNFGLDQGEDMEMCYAAASAHNRMMTDFCKVDRRLLATAYVPLEDFARAIATAREAIELGAKALMIPSWCPQHHGPSHIALDPVWAMAQEAGIPILFHVGGEDKLNPVYKINGLPPVPDFHGGDDNFTSVSYMPIPNSMMQTIATLIFDGVFDRFPRLKWGAIELGASWLPGWMRAMDSPRTPSSRMKSACASCRQAVRDRASPVAGGALPARRHRLDHRQLQRRRSAVLVGLPAHRRRTRARSSASTNRWPAPHPRRCGGSMPTTSST